MMTSVTVMMIMMITTNATGTAITMIPVSACRATVKEDVDMAESLLIVVVCNNNVEFVTTVVGLVILKYDTDVETAVDALVCACNVETMGSTLVQDTNVETMVLVGTPMYDNDVDITMVGTLVYASDVETVVNMCTLV